MSPIEGVKEERRSPSYSSAHSREGDETNQNATSSTPSSSRVNAQSLSPVTNSSMTDSHSLRSAIIADTALPKTSVQQANSQPRMSFMDRIRQVGRKRAATHRAHGLAMGTHGKPELIALELPQMPQGLVITPEPTIHRSGIMSGSPTSPRMNAPANGESRSY